MKLILILIVAVCAGCETREERHERELEAYVKAQQAIRENHYRTSSSPWKASP